MRLRWAWLLLLALLWFGCAKKGAPSGGPVDEVAPVIVSVYPESLAVLVPRDTLLTVTFSEKIQAEALDRAIWIIPQSIVIKDISRDEFTLKVKFRDPLPESTAVTVLVGTSLADRRGNRLQEPKQWVFSTGPTLPGGSVSGLVKRDGGARETRGERILVGVYAAPDTIPNFVDTAPVSLTEVGPTGTFLLQGLAWGRVAVVPFVDRNGNSVSDARDEYVSAKFDTVVLSPEAPKRTLALRLVDPEAPGLVAGTVSRAAQDSAALGVELYAAADDSLSEAVAGAAVGNGGSYVVTGVPSGLYRLVAFCDLNTNTFRDAVESWMVWEDTLQVFPGDTTRVDTLQALDCGRENE